MLRPYKEKKPTLSLRLRLCGWRLLLRRARAAGRRDDAVHAQVLDHLAVVVHGMKSADIGDREACGEEREHRLGQWRDLVFGGDCGNGLMAERERVLQVLDNFGFGLQLGGAVGFRLDVLRVEVLSQERAEEKMIGEADVLHLFGESAHALELATGRRKPVLVFGHGLGGRNDLLLDNAVNRVEDGRDGRRLLRLLGR